MHGVNSILINSKTTNWLKIGQGAKFLGFAGNLAGMVPTAFDIRSNGINADNFLDGMISGSSFVPVFGWVLSPTLQGWKNSVERRIKVGDGEDVIRSLEILMMMNCFAEGSQVLMGDETLKNIEFVEIGDTVLTYCFAYKKLERNLVLKIDNPVHHKLIKIVFSNGAEIISTEDHPYYVKDKGLCSFNPEQTKKNYSITTRQMYTADYCFTNKGNRLGKIKVAQIVPFEKSIKTYNLSGIANSNNYFVNGILVNNESPELPLDVNTP